MRISLWKGETLIKVRPIYGDNPGPCQVWHGEKACGDEAVVRAEVPIPDND